MIYVWIRELRLSLRDFCDNDKKFISHRTDIIAAGSSQRINYEMSPTSRIKQETEKLESADTTT